MATVEAEARPLGSSGGMSVNKSIKGSIGKNSSSTNVKQQNVVIDIESEDLTYN